MTFDLDLKIPEDGGSSAAAHEQITSRSNEGDVTFRCPSSVRRHPLSSELNSPPPPSISFLSKRLETATEPPPPLPSVTLNYSSFPRGSRGSFPGSGAQSPTAPPAPSSPAARRRPYRAPRATEPAKQAINSGN